MKIPRVQSKSHPKCLTKSLWLCVCQRIWLNTCTHKAFSVSWKRTRRPKLLLGCIKSENWKQTGIVDRTCLDPNPSISRLLMISPQSTCWLIQISRSARPPHNRFNSITSSSYSYSLPSDIPQTCTQYICKWILRYIPGRGQLLYLPLMSHKGFISSRN